MENTAERQMQMVQRKSVFDSIQVFEDAQRMAKPMSTTQFVPKQFQGRVDDCLIAMEMSFRMGISPMMVLQNIYIVYGRPSFSSKFLIGLVNASKRFKTGIRFEYTGKKGTDSYGCIAWLKDWDDTILKGPEVTIGMAKAEGWFTKNGSKWPNMPDLMLQWRAGSFFVNAYAPEIALGIQTTEEIIDVEHEPEKKSSLFSTELPSQTPPPLPPQQKQETIEEKPQVEAEAVVCDEKPKKQQTKQKEQDLFQKPVTLNDETDVAIGEWLRKNYGPAYTAEDVKEACQNGGIKYGIYLIEGEALGMQTVFQYMIKK